MKKLIAMLLALVMVLSMGACAAKDQKEPTEAPKPAETETTPEEKPEEKPAEETAEKPEETAGEGVEGIPATVKLSDSKGLEGKRIGCTIVYKGDEWCFQLSKALETLGKYYGAEITVEDGDANDETQTKQIENMVANGVDIIFADPLTPDGSSEALMKAVNADIPVVIYDGYWADSEGKTVSTITWDQFETGRIVGDYFVNYVKENMDGKCTVIEMANALSTHCQERFVGFNEVVDEANKNGCEIKILNKYDSQGNRELAYNAIAAVVEPYDFIISDVDNGAMGSVAALEASGNDKVKVLSMGAYGQEPFGMLHDNHANYLACLNVDAWVLAQGVMNAALDYFDGKEVAPVNNIPLYMVDNSNVTDFWTFE